MAGGFEPPVRPSIALPDVECVWNVMTHAQKPHFVFRRNGRVHLLVNRRGRQFSCLLAAEVCASAVVMLDTPCSEVVWRLLATHSIRQFPLHFPSRASPCAITFQLDSTKNARLQGVWPLVGRPSPPLNVRLFTKLMFRIIISKEQNSGWGELTVRIFPATTRNFTKVCPTEFKSQQQGIAGARQGHRTVCGNEPKFLPYLEAVSCERNCHFVEWLIRYVVQNNGFYSWQCHVVPW